VPDRNDKDFSNQPKLDYLTLGFDPSSSYIEPPEEEPERPEIQHIPNSSMTRLNTVAQKIRDGSL
jgi:hypothetical protein